MPKTTYPWKRFWCPRTGALNFSYGGYLWDPDDKYGSIYNPDVKRFSEIDRFSVLGLLGEPGIGKTYALEQLVETTKNDIAQENGYVLYLNLNAIGSEDRLERKLFHSDEFKAWKAEKKPLHIFLDSFDECLLNIPTLSKFFSEELKNISTENLFIRIACRTHDWPIGLEEFLIDHWGDENVGVYELAPLRQIDVIEAVKINRLNPDKFLEEVQNCEVVPFAIKPITLQMLINVFKHESGFPTSKMELYAKGCLSLAAESNISRRDAKRYGNLSPEQRVLIAARIAALTVLGGKNAIWTGASLSDNPCEDLILADIAGGSEYLNGNELRVSEKAIREVLGDTGFFSSRGTSRAGWAHQTYAEYLASYYMSQHNVHADQIISLLCHPEDPDKKIVPQLAEVAAWAASQNDEIFTHLMMADPEVLLRGDFASISEESRKNLAKELLALYATGDAVDNDWDLKNYYSKLNHPDLANQLRLYINDSSKNIIVRRVAIDIAESCNLATLQQELLIVGLDQSEDYHIRCQAIHAVCLIGDDETKKRLRPLAFGKAGDDPDDELKAQALRVLWPAQMTAEELFGQLTPPQNKNLIGAYYFFLSETLYQGLNENNILIALEWVSTLYSKWKGEYLRKRLIKGIFTKAWGFLNSTVIADAFLQVVLVPLREHNLELLESLISNDDKRKRHLLLDSLLAVPNDEKLDPYYYSHSNIVNTDDMPWLIERSKGESNQVRRFLADLAKEVFNFKDTDLILEACEQDSIFAEVFKDIREPVQLDSPEAERMRRRHSGRNRDREDISPSLMDGIIKNLKNSESGNIDIWPSLRWNMSIDKYGHWSWPKADHRESHGWKNADDLTRERIISATKEYILNGTPKIETLFEQSTEFEALASDHALQLLYKEAPNFVLSLSSDTWEKWAKVVLVNSSHHDSERDTILLSMAYHSAPEEIIEGILQTIDKDKNNQSIFFHHIENIWDERISEAIFNKLCNDQLPPEAEGSLLEGLLKQEYEKALPYTENLIINPLSSDEEARNRSLIAASNLLMYAPDAGWHIIWPFIQADADFGRELVTNISSREMIIPRLTDPQATDLYIWLEKNYPGSKEKDDDSRTNSRDFKESLFRHLKARGTEGACTGLAKIVAAFPEKAWFKWSLRDCRAIYRRNSWIPPSSKEILSLTENRDLCLVRSGLELIEVIITSLKRLEQNLHGTTPMARFLWNNDNRPKSENDFSDYIKDHLEKDLKDRGIVSNREVEFRRLNQSGVGEKTDIAVDAVAKKGDHYETISVVIESKGCWNKELKTAMESQLRDKYLIDDQYRFGLYLIGWFLCNKWDKSHYQKKDTLALNLSYEEAKSFFNKQAEELSNESTCLKTFVLNAMLPED